MKVYLNTLTDEDHLVILGSESVDGQMTVRPICTLNVLCGSLGLGMVAATGDLLALVSLAFLHCSTVAVLIASQYSTLWQTADHHLSLCGAVCSHGAYSS